MMTIPNTHNDYRRLALKARDLKTVFEHLTHEVTGLVKDGMTAKPAPGG